MNKPSTQPATSYDTRTIITVICLLAVYPVGVIMMFAWMVTWPTWAKVLIALPCLLGIVALFFVLVAIIFAGLNPAGNDMPATSLLLELLG